MKSRKFEVTQFFPLSLSSKYFVKRGEFTPLELRHIQMLRQQLHRRFPQRKQTADPASWRLTVETNLTLSPTMEGRLQVLLPNQETLSLIHVGSVEVVCENLAAALTAAT